MNGAEINIKAMDNFKNACKRHCDIIETCLLDFEKYGISELLGNTANSINQIKVSAKSAAIENAVKLATNMQNVISFAIESKIDLYANDIDILLRANDLFFSVQQFSNAEIVDLFEFEEVIINEFINEIKTIVAPYRVKKVARKKEVTTTEILSEEKENKAILLEKFKFELVKSTHTIQQTLEIIQDDSGTIDIIPVSNALNTIKGAAISAGIGKAFDLADSMQDFLAFTADNNIPISSYQMDILIKCNRLFKEIAASSAIALIDKFKDYSDFIDNYTDFLQNFLSDNDSPEKPISSKIVKNDIIFNDFDNPSDAQNQDKLFYFGYKSSNVKDSSKYNRMLESSISVVSNLFPLKKANSSIKDLKQNLRQIQLDSNNILYNITNTEKITELVLSVSERLDSLIDDIDEYTKFIDNSTEKIKNKIDAVYNNLFSLRSVAFGDLILGFNELTADLANHSNKKVKLKLIGRFVRVGAEITPLLEIVLPQILRYMIMSNIEKPDARLESGKRESSEITITAHLISGRLFIDFEDDGAGRDSNLQAVEIENIITLINNNKGKIEIRSEQGVGTKISLSFDLDYILLKSLLFELGGNLYAIQIIDTEGMLDADDEESMPKGVQKVDMRKLLKVKGSYISTNKPAVLIKQYNSDYALCFDKFVGEAELVPMQPSKLFGKNPYISATSIYNDAPVVIIDIAKLLNVLVK